MTSRVVIVGGGPRAIMLLERIVARTDAGTDLHIDLVDPHPLGAGRIWRRAQSPLLKLNSMAQDVTVFTDDSCSIEGPVVAGPSLIEWVQQWREGRLPDVEIDDEVVATEARALTGEGFPTRRLQSYYLAWFARRVIDSAPESVVIQTHRDEVTGVRAVGARWDVALASGEALAADAVVYAIGHLASTPASDSPSAVLADAARSAGLAYVPPAFTADLDLDGIPASDVIVRGLGLASVDLVVLLTQGRGGRFERTTDGLRYIASGREPRLHLGSRRGVPYRSKVSSQIRGEAPRREVLTPSVIAALAASAHDGRLLDFERDAWPLIASELLHGHYRELFTGHPGRVTGTWEQARALLSNAAWDDPALHAALAELVPDPLDRLDVAVLDRPFAGALFADADDAHAAVIAHIRTDLQLRTTAERSPAQGLFIASLLSFLALSEIPAERWNARSRAELLPVRWHTFFSYVASGPPAHRLEELLALAEAGVVRFLGPDVEVAIERDPSSGGTFVASSPSRPGTTRAATLIDAWLPPSDAATSRSAALRELASVHGRVLRLTDGETTRTIGRVVVDADGRLQRADGSRHETLFAIGPFTSHPEGGAFTRPRSDALAFRQTDRVAGAILGRLIGSRGGRPRAAEPEIPELSRS